MGRLPSFHRFAKLMDAVRVDRLVQIAEVGCAVEEPYR